MWARATTASLVFSEISYWSSTNEKVLGIVTFDKTDRDFGYIVLARDAKRRYRAVDVDTSLFSRRTAETALKRKLAQLANAPAKRFHQGDESGEWLDLFTRAVAKKKLHPNFVAAMESEHLSPALGILKEMANVFDDKDGNFVKDFQTTGFNSRLWELYLFAALVEQGLKLESIGTSPDFVAAVGPNVVCVEAVTVNATATVKPDELPNPHHPSGN